MKKHKTKTIEAASLPPRYLRGTFPLLWIAILGFLIYGQTISYDYTYLDDHAIILNQMDRINTVTYIPQAFKVDAFHSASGKGFYYRPMLTISFVLDAIIGGGAFTWFHFTNILLHVLAAWFLFLLLLELGYERIKSFLFSLLFLAHPLLTHAVAWVPGRNDTLLAVFLLPSFLFFLRYLKTRRSGYGALHIVFYLLALFTKESAIALPVIALIYFWAVVKKPGKALLLPLACWVILTPVWMWIRYKVLGDSNGYPLSDSVLSMLHNLPALLPFVGKSVFPVGLSVFPILKDMILPMVAGFVGIIGLGVLLFMTKEKRWGMILFAASWFLLFLLPSFIKTKSQDADFTEHRIYISMAGLFILLLETGLIRNASLKDKPFRIGFLAVFLIFSVLTFFHSKNYSDRFAFWKNAVNTSPSHAFNYNNLGAMYFLEKNLPEAEKYFRKAIAINPVEPLANGNLGLICMNTNRPDEAEKFYIREIEVNPTYDNVYFNLGILYYQKRLPETAIKLWEHTIELNPRLTGAYFNLVVAYTQLNRPADAERVKALAAANGIDLNQR